MYKNFVIFSDGWTIHSVEKNMSKYELEAYKEYLDYFKGKIFYASDYFEPVKNYPEKIVIEDVIEEFNELLLIEKYSNNRYIGNRENVYSLKFNFKELLNQKITNAFEYITFEINIEDLDISDFPFLIKYKADIEKDIQNENNYEMNFVLEENEEFFNSYLKRNKVEILDEFEGLKDFKFSLSKNEKGEIKFEKIEFNNRVKKEIITDYLNLFHRLFGVYYNIQIDEKFENIKLIKF